MKSFVGFVIVTAVLCVVGGIYACDQDGAHHSVCAPGSIPIEIIRASAEDLGIEPPPSVELVLTFPLADMEILKVKACRVEIIGRIPRYQIVFVNIDSSWSPLMLDKSLVSEWASIAATLITKSCYDAVGHLTCRDPDALARDLSQLLVDPVGGFGYLLYSRDSIPTNIDLSDRRRDLVRKGFSDDEIRDLLLSKAPGQIRGPHFENQDGKLELQFFSWNYFGGDVQEWKIIFSPELRTSRVQLANRVGSYGYY